MISSYHIDYYCFHADHEPVILYPEPEPIVAPTPTRAAQVSSCQKYSYASIFMALSLSDAAASNIIQNVFSKGMLAPMQLSHGQQLYAIVSVISLVQGTYILFSKSQAVLLSAKINLVINDVLQIVALGLLISKN